MVPVPAVTKAVRQWVLFIAGIKLNLAAALAQHHPCLVDDDAGKPGAQQAAAFELGNGAVGSDPAILHRFFRIHGRQHGASGGQQHVVMGFDQ